jgi:hypothetical protein
MNMNNQILSLNQKVNDMQFSIVPRPRPPFPPTPPPRKHAAEVDWCHFFQDFHDPVYCYAYTHHMELSKNGKEPLPPVKKNLLPLPKMTKLTWNTLFPMMMIFFLSEDLL